MAWVTADTVDGQTVNGKPRRIWWENNEGVGMPIYAAPQPAPDVEALVEALERSVAGFDALSGMASLDAGARNYARQKAIELNASLAAYRKQGDKT